MSDPSKLQEELAQAAAAGNFLACLDDHVADWRELAAAVVSLHNAGTVDVITEFQSIASDPTPRFFTLSHILGTALPKLEAEPVAVANCVEHLTKLGGNDMAAGNLLQPFLEYIAVNQDRVDAIQEAAAGQPDRFVSSLYCTLRAQFRLDPKAAYQQVEACAQDGHSEVRRIAFWALGSFEALADGERMVALLEAHVQTEEEDNVLRAIVVAAGALAAADQQSARMAEVVSTACSRGSLLTMHGVAEVLFQQAKRLPPAFVSCVLLLMQGLSPDSARTLDSLDMALGHLLRKPRYTGVGDPGARRTSAKQLTGIGAALSRDSPIRWLPSNLRGRPWHAPVSDHSLVPTHRSRAMRGHLRTDREDGR